MMGTIEIAFTETLFMFLFSSFTADSSIHKYLPLIIAILLPVCPSLVSCDVSGLLYIHSPF